MNTSIPMVAVGIAMIAEPGDGVLNHVLNGYVESVGGGYVNAYQQFLIDLENDTVRLPGVITNDEMAQALERWRPRLSADLARHAVNRLAPNEIEVMFPDDDKWPTRVDRLGVHRPRVLFLKGDANLFGHGDVVAMVGARASTGYGEHVAQDLAAGLVDRGVVIVSGGAFGIDGIAHRATLAGNGKTIAVLAGGLDRIYPHGHEDLMQRVAKAGLLVSEVQPGATPTKWRFLQRNRIIAAASDAVVVVEAGVRSGSLNTVAHAASLGMPIGAVPGPITSPASAGCHRAISEFSAAVITSTEDVAALLTR